MSTCRRCSAWLNFLATVLIAVVTTCFAVDGTAWAADPARERAAANMAKQAQSAYEAGDYERSMRLYYEAYRGDASKVMWVFSAGRAAQVGGNLEKAAEYYLEYLADAEKDPRFADKAKEFLREVNQARADHRTKEGDRNAAAGDHALASGLYREAFKLAPDRPQLLFKAGVEAQAAGMRDEAVALLQTYLQRAPAGAMERASAQNRLKQLGGKASTAPIPTPAKPREPEAPPPPPILDSQAEPPVQAKRLPPPVEVKPGPVPEQPRVTPKPLVVREKPAPARIPAEVVSREPAAVQPSSGRSTAGWSLLAGGVVTGTVAALVYFGAAADRDALETKVDPGFHSQAVTSIGYEDATTQADSIGTRLTISAVLGGVAAVASGLGVYLAVTEGESAQVTVLPTLGGGALVARF